MSGHRDARLLLTELDGSVLGECYASLRCEPAGTALMAEQEAEDRWMLFALNIQRLIREKRHESREVVGCRRSWPQLGLHCR